jgi:hypothetical protein
LDLSDADELLAFASEYGVLGIRTRNFDAISGLPELNIRYLRNAIARATEQASDPRPWRDDYVRVETLAEFRFAAAVLHDLTNLAFIAMGSRESVEWRVLEDVSQPYLAAHRLERALNPALAPFHPRLMVRQSKTYAGLPTTPGRAAEADFAAAPLFCICALELFNHITEAAEYKRCAECQRLFVRQEGRARSGQHRITGVEFCSKSCLGKQKQREYRKRVKERKRGGDDV